jgi:hypothetical protein
MGGTSAPLSVLEVYLNTNPMTNAAKAGAEAAKNLGFEARILGRDVLRLSGVVENFAGIFMKGWTMMTASSLNLGAAMEDINWALEDIAASIGDALSPILEVVADILDKVADAFEGLPDPLKMIIGLVILGGIVLLTLTSLFMKFWGALTMLRGTMKATSKDASNLFNTFRNAFPFLKGSISNTEKLAMIQGSLTDKTIALNLAQQQLKNTRKEIQKIVNENLLSGADENTMNADKAKKLADLRAEEAKQQDTIIGTKEEMSKLKKEREALNKGEAKGKKEGKGVADVFKSIGGTIKNLVMTLGPMAILFLAMGPIIELITPIFEAIADAFETVFESLEPVIDMIVDFIENNQELVVAILLSLAGVMLFAKFIPGFTSTLGKLGDKFGLITSQAEGTGDAVTGTGTSAWKNIAAFAALVLALTPLLLSINEILKTIGTFKMSLGDLFGYLGTLSVNIIAITGALVFFIKSMSGMQADTYKAVGVLIALSLAVDILIGMFTLFLTVVGNAGMSVSEVVGFLFSMAGAIGSLMGIMTGIIVILNAFSGQIMQGAAAMIVMVIPILMLMAGFTGMFAALGAMGGNMGDLIAVMYGFVGAVLALFTGMAVLVVVFSALAANPFVWLGVGLMYALAGAALLAAVAFLIFSVAVQNLANAFISVMTASGGFFTSLITSVPQIAVALGMILALGAAFLGLGLSLLIAMPGLFLGAAGIAMVASSIGLLALAIGALAGALNSIPAWATGMVGGIAGLIGGVMGAIPMLQAGGVVEKGGIAYLEPAEVVIPPGGAVRGAGSIYNTYNIQATIREDADIDKLAKKISEKQSKEYGGRVY